MELRKSMKLETALGHINLSKSSYCYQSRPWSEDKRVFPLDRELEQALKEMCGYELTLGYGKATPYLDQKPASGQEPSHPEQQAMGSGYDVCADTHGKHVLVCDRRHSRQRGGGFLHGYPVWSPAGH